VYFFRMDRCLEGSIMNFTQVLLGRSSHIIVVGGE
jgi:hypothetical protein